MLMRWEPFAGLFAWQRAMDRLMTPEWMISEPDLDLVRTRDGLMVRIALPGIRSEDVEVQVRGDRLTIRAQARQDRAIDRYGWTYRERRVGFWERTLRLPFRVDTRRAEAELAGGVLTVRLPRAEGGTSRLKNRLRRALRALRLPRRQTVRVRAA